MRVATSPEMVRKIFPDVEVILDQGSYFAVWRKNRRGVTIIPKPRPLEEVLQILEKGGFPNRFLKLLPHLKRTKAIEAILKKDSAMLFGPAGVGKTTASVWRIAKMVQTLKVSNPQYLSAVDFEPERVKEIKETADCVLIDDLNPRVIPEWKLQLVVELIYHAHNKDWKLFLTSNDGLKLPQPILSRLVEICGEPIRLQGEDLRLRSIKADKNPKL